MTTPAEHPYGSGAAGFEIPRPAWADPEPVLPELSGPLNIAGSAPWSGEVRMRAFVTGQAIRPSPSRRPALSPRSKWSPAAVTLAREPDRIADERTVNC